MQEQELVVFSFTKRGTELNEKLCSTIRKNGGICNGFTTGKYASGTISPLPPDPGKWIGMNWGTCGFVFVGAAGIAVRYIAPWVKDKFSDSPVVVMDEKGEYVIPILSGHAGGAAALADELALVTGGTAVHTTATDVNGKFAVDVFAVRNNLYITDRKAAKAISAAVLEGEKIGVCILPDSVGNEIPVQGEIPEDIVLCRTLEELETYRYGVIVAEQMDEIVVRQAAGKDGLVRLVLRTRSVTAGIGCRKGVKAETLEAGLASVLAENGLLLSQVESLASIDLKKEEPGILDLSRKYEIPFTVYKAEELRQIREVTVRSAFVEQTAGVDNVCERAARLCCPDGTIVQGKCIRNGMTVALSVRSKNLRFS